MVFHKIEFWTQPPSSSAPNISSVRRYCSKIRPTLTFQHLLSNGSVYSCCFGFHEPLQFIKPTKLINKIKEDKHVLKLHQLESHPYHKPDSLGSIKVILKTNFSTQQYIFFALLKMKIKTKKVSIIDQHTICCID